MNTNELCKLCKKNPADELHTCPFAEEIYGDKQLCNCCQECTNRCCEDI